MKSCENRNREPSVHLPIARDYGVAQVLPLGEAQVCGAMGDKRVQFPESALVQERIYALAGGKLALCMLLIYAGLTSSKGGLFPQLA